MKQTQMKPTTTATPSNCSLFQRNPRQRPKPPVRAKYSAPGYVNIYDGKRIIGRQLVRRSNGFPKGKNRTQRANLSFAWSCRNNTHSRFDQGFLF